MQHWMRTFDGRGTRPGSDSGMCGPRTVRGALALALVAGALTGATSAGTAAAAAVEITVTTDRPVSNAVEGTVVRIGIRAATADGGALPDRAAVTWSTGSGTATAGSDYTPASGTVAFPAGTSSGTTRFVGVSVLGDTAAETAETVPIRLASAAAGTLVVGTPTLVIDAHGLPYLDAALPVATRVDDLLRRMTLAEKVGQMTQSERKRVDDDPDLVSQWRLGSLLSAGGSVPSPNTPSAWADMVDRFQAHARQTRLQIPLIYGVDAVHGHGNLRGATVFPHNIGLGATRDVPLVRQVGRVTAREVRATGIPWNFSPCLCVTRDARWGRSYESFGEDPALVASMTPIVTGMQGGAGALADPDRVLATAKHFAGDGGTRYGTAAAPYVIDRGVTVTTRADWDRLDVAPYRPAVARHRVGSVMPSFSSVDFLGDALGPVKMHANREQLTGLLKGTIGFGGFVVSDWEATSELPGDWATQVRSAANAGVDMFMEPDRFRELHTTLLAEARAGRVPVSRIDDAVRRILTKKFELGLFEQPFAVRTHLGSVGSASHRAVARRAVTRSQVLLKNAGGLLPLPASARLYVAGRNAADIGNQSGGWTTTWQGVSGNAAPGTSVLDGIRRVAPSAQVTYSRDATASMAGSDVGVVVVGETPYAEGYGDVGGPQWRDGGVAREPKSLSLQQGDQAVVDRVCTTMPSCVVLIVSGRPQALGAQLAGVDALVASWLPGSEGAGVADALFGVLPFTGRLPVTWPRNPAQEPINVGDATYAPAFPFGWGLRTDPGRARLSRAEASLSAPGADAAALQAAADLRAALTAGNWNADGSVRNEVDVVARLASAAAFLVTSRVDTTEGDVVVSVVRDVAQRAIVARRASSPADAAALTADAESALLRGRPDTAVGLLRRAAGTLVGPG